VDDDVATVLDRHAAPPARFLDVGTGPGTVAIEAARRGFSVVATDVSERALEIAARRAGPLPIAWVADDVTETRLRGTFDVVHDRGCLHVLDPAERPGYARSVERLTAPGGLVVVKAHAPEAPAEIGTSRFTPGEVAAVFGDGFEMLSAERSTFPGPSGAVRAATLCALRRRA
jgi:2-polyprenyl-3-methyl-5-hydroxy-6-metoxy-1,4-benzoquinol methylase